MTWVRAGILTGICDALWATALQLAYGRPVLRVWQGVASVPFGARMLETQAGVAIGLLLHFCVAFAWSGVLLFLLRHTPPLHPALVGAVFGPLIWIVMSFAVIPPFTHQLPPVNARWWVQLVGHAVFVGQPMAWSYRDVAWSSR